MLPEVTASGYHRHASGLRARATPMTYGIMPDWSWIMGFIFGAAIGSFLNVVIYRLPRRISLLRPSKSFCPLCKHDLGPRDLIPLYSWLSTRGRCYYCEAKIAPRYFLVELLLGAIWAGLWNRFLVLETDVPRAVIFALASAVLVAAIFIDWELFIIPDELNAILLGLGVALAAFTRDWRLALFGAFVGWGLLWGITFLGRLALGKDAMGHGDIKLMRGIGALLGPFLTVATLIIGVLLGLVVGVVALLAARKQPVATSAAEEAAETPESIGSLVTAGAWYLLLLDIVGIFFPKIYAWIGVDLEKEALEDEHWQPSLTTIPFGPYLGAGALGCMLFGPQIEGLYQAYLRYAGFAGR
jgi:leader peptidase (prepilin peptidase)/N-methyltransferase